MKITMDMPVIETAEYSDSDIKFHALGECIGGVFYGSIGLKYGWYTQVRDLTTKQWRPINGPFKTRDKARSALIKEIGLKETQ